MISSLYLCMRSIIIYWHVPYYFILEIRFAIAKCNKIPTNHFILELHKKQKQIWKVGFIFPFSGNYFFSLSKRYSYVKPPIEIGKLLFL